jgi:hypothetical protein
VQPEKAQSNIANFWFGKPNSERSKHVISPLDLPACPSPLAEGGRMGGASRKHNHKKEMKAMTLQAKLQSLAQQRAKAREKEERERERKEKRVEKKIRALLKKAGIENAYVYNVYAIPGDERANIRFNICNIEVRLNYYTSLTHERLIPDSCWRGSGHHVFERTEQPFTLEGLLKACNEWIEHMETHDLYLEQPEPVHEDLGTRFVVSGGEVLELKS